MGEVTTLYTSQLHNYMRGTFQESTLQKRRQLSPKRRCATVNWNEKPLAACGWNCGVGGFVTRRVSILELGLAAARLEPKEPPFGRAAISRST